MKYWKTPLLKRWVQQAGKTSRLLNRYFANFGVMLIPRREVGDLLADMGAAMLFVRYAQSLRGDCCLREYNSECSDVMRRVFWRYTDVSCKLCMECGKTRVLEELAFDLESNRSKITSNQVPEVISSSLGILHNCAKVKDNIRYFTDTIVRVLRSYSEQKNDGFDKLVAILALSYVMIDSDKESVGTKVNALLLTEPKKAVDLSDHRTVSLGFSALELVDGLLQLAGNDSNKKLMLESGLNVLDILANLLETGNDDEKSVSINTVWGLAFTKDNKISEHSKIMSLLQGMKDDTESPFRQEANSALWVLAGGNQQKPSSGTIKEVQSDSIPSHQAETIKCDSKNAEGRAERIQRGSDSKDLKHIMISYRRNSSKEIALMIKERLNRLRYRVWIDEENITSPIYESMAAAVENSSVFILFVSRGYKDSNFCQMEATYAVKCKVHIIPVLTEQGYTADGWLGLLVAGLLHVDLRPDVNSERKFQKLVKCIGDKAKPFGDDPVIMPNFGMDRSIQRTEVSPPAKPVEQWSVEEVQDWAKGFKLKAEIFKDMNGKDLISLLKIKKTSPAAFYQYFFGKSDASLRNLLTFYSAIEQLDEKYNWD